MKHYEVRNVAVCGWKDLKFLQLPAQPAPGFSTFSLQHWSSFGLSINRLAQSFAMIQMWKKIGPNRLNLCLNEFEVKPMRQTSAAVQNKALGAEPT